MIETLLFICIVLLVVCIILLILNLAKKSPQSVGKDKSLNEIKAKLEEGVLHEENKQ